MSTHFVFRPGAVSDDCYQGAAAGFWVTGQSDNHVAATTAAVNNNQSIGIRFAADPSLGTAQIPAGTVQIPRVAITFYANANTGTVPITVVAQKFGTQAGMSTGPVTFKSSNGAGTADLNGGSSGRTWTTATSSHTIPHLTSNQSITLTIDPSVAKELMIAAGATFNGPDPLIADTPTAVPITAPTFKFDPVTLAPGSSPSTTIFAVYPYDSYSAGSTNDKPVLYLQLPRLEIDAIPAEPVLVGDDERVHIMLCTDSIGWGMGNGFTAPYKIPQCRLSLGFIGGTLDTTGLIDLTDTSWDTVPTGESYGGVNRGYATLYDQASGKWVAFNDPNGTGGHGALIQEGRSGYTARGVLKDRLLKQLGVNDRDVVIHSFVYGGTTARAVGTSSGVWASATGPHETEVLLSTITDYSDLSSIDNFLWTQNYDSGGQNALDVLRDPTIKKLLFVYIGGGNDALSSSYFGNGGNLKLPLSVNNPTDLTAFETTTTTGYETIFNFAKGVRDHYATFPDYVHEEHLLGYYNFVTHDPRIPEINVNTGAPPLAAFHQGSYTTVSGHLDAWYGGKDGDQKVVGSTTKIAMSPFGNTTSDTAASPGPGQPNVIPYVPLFLQYGGQNLPIIGSSIPAPSTNIAGGLPVAWTAARPMTKDDLGFTLNVKLATYFGNTYLSEVNDTSTSGYGWWFSHAGADHFGGSMGASADASGWNTAAGVLLAGGYNSFPYSSFSQQNLPWNNIPIAVPYCTRNITNDNVNTVLRDMIKPAALAAVANLQAAGHQIMYIDMGDSLGTAYGTGDYASGDLSTTIDGVHPTHSGAITFNNAYIDRALAQDSQLMGELAARGLEPMMFAVV